MMAVTVAVAFADPCVPQNRAFKLLKEKTKLLRRSEMHCK
jgi:hypothetical protein